MPERVTDNLSGPPFIEFLLGPAPDRGAGVPPAAEPPTAATPGACHRPTACRVGDRESEQGFKNGQINQPKIQSVSIPCILSRPPACFLNLLATHKQNLQNAISDNNQRMSLDTTQTNKQHPIHINVSPYLPSWNISAPPSRLALGTLNPASVSHRSLQTG
jgi:hypothetical protein